MKDEIIIVPIIAPVKLLIKSIGLKVLLGKKYFMHSNKMAELPTINIYFNIVFLEKMGPPSLISIKHNGMKMRKEIKCIR